MVRHPYRYHRSIWDGIWIYVLIFFLFLAIACGGNYLLGKSASQSNAEKALSNQGFEQIHLVKRHVFFVELQGCGKEDVAKFDFTAVNPRNQLVHVSVCEGWPFKGATVRST